jgi:glutamate 5-kinase
MISELRKQILTETKRLVVKVGSKLLVDLDNGGIRVAQINRLVGSLAKLHNAGYEVVLVTSGAVGAGMDALGLKTKPTNLSEKQACAALGQIKLMHIYQQAFKKRNIHAGQILLSADDFRNRDRYRNIQNTFKALLAKKIIPVINENDSVAVDEIKVGDNDKLSADVAQFLDADLLILFTDEDGLYDKNPRRFNDARLIPVVAEITAEILEGAGSAGSAISTGGMKSKLEAINEVIKAGCSAVLANGNTVLPDEIMKGKRVGTLFLGNPKKWPARKKWLAFVSKPKAKLMIDAGAVIALREKNSSLLSMGVKSLKGKFEKGDLVEISDENGAKIARGIANLGHTEMDNTMRQLIIHKNNMVLL